MSDFWIIVVEISARGSVAEQRAAEVTTWLLDTGAIVDNDRADSLLHPEPFWPGPNGSRAIVDPFWYKQAAGVAVHLGWRIHDPGGNFEPPGCPMCASLPDNHEEYVDLVVQWYEERQEPPMICGACDISSPVGDWVGQFGLQAAELAVYFHRWPPMREDFLAEMGQRLGPRWRVIYQHF